MLRGVVVALLVLLLALVAPGLAGAQAKWLGRVGGLH
jgi:type II secretory pathway pseudopilin PulG